MKSKSPTSVDESPDVPENDVKNVSTPDRVKPVLSRSEIRRAQLILEEKTRAKNIRIQEFNRNMVSVHTLFSEIEQTFRALERLSFKVQEIDPLLRRSRENDLSSRIGYRAICSAIFGSTRMIQSVLKYKNRIKDVERDILEELGSK